MSNFEYTIKINNSGRTALANIDEVKKSIVKLVWRDYSRLLGLVTYGDYARISDYIDSLNITELSIENGYIIYVARGNILDDVISVDVHSARYCMGG